MYLGFILCNVSSGCVAPVLKRCAVLLAWRSTLHAFPGSHVMARAVRSRRELGWQDERTLW